MEGSLAKEFGYKCKAILNLLGPTGSDVIVMDPVRLKNLNEATMAQKNRETNGR